MQREDKDTQTQGEDSHMKTEAETEVLQLQAKECQRLPKNH